MVTALNIFKIILYLALASPLVLFFVTFSVIYRGLRHLFMACTKKMDEGNGWYFPLYLLLYIPFWIAMHLQLGTLWLLDRLKPLMK